MSGPEGSNDGDSNSLVPLMLGPHEDVWRSWVLRVLVKGSSKNYPPNQNQ